MEGGNDDQYSLKWNNFQNNLATGFHELLQEETMLDVTLAMEGKYLQAHKIVLSVCSPYFKDLFKANPCKHPIIILKDVSHQHMSDMLEFMYLGEANVRQDDLSGFLKLAETLKVKGLAGDKANENETPQQVRRQPLQVPKKKKVADAFELDDHDPGDSDFNPGGGELRRKRRRSSPPPKTDSVMPSNSSSAQPIPVANPKQEIPEEEVELLDPQEEGDALSQLLENAPKQENDQQDFDDSNFDNTLDDTGDGAQDNDFDMSAGPSNHDESTDQVPQDSTEIVLRKTSKGGPMLGWRGYYYSISSRSSIRISWRCIKYYHGCKAVAYVTRKGQISFSGTHTHNKERDFDTYAANPVSSTEKVAVSEKNSEKVPAKTNAIVTRRQIKKVVKKPAVKATKQQVPTVNEKAVEVVNDKNPHGLERFLRVKIPQIIVSKCSPSTDTNCSETPIKRRNTVGSSGVRKKLGNRKIRKRFVYNGNWYVKQRYNKRAACFQWECVKPKCLAKCLVSDSGGIVLKGQHTCKPSV